MLRDRPGSPRVIQILLDVERPLPPLPAFTRARALARARQVVAQTPPAPPALLARGVPGWTLPLAIAGASIATLGIVHRFDARAQRPPALLVIADNFEETMASDPHIAGPFRVVPEILLARGDDALPGQVALAARQSVPSRDELALLQRARAAVAANDWGDAHSAVSEHARRFPVGQLAEEREALRVKTLIGLGRQEEARQAARAFEARFPRSVLGPAVTSAGGELL